MTRTVLAAVALLVTLGATPARGQYFVPPGYHRFPGPGFRVGFAGGYYTRAAWVNPYFYAAPFPGWGPGWAPGVGNPFFLPYPAGLADPVVAAGGYTAEEADALIGGPFSNRAAL